MLTKKNYWRNKPLSLRKNILFFPAPTAKSNLNHENDNHLIFLVSCTTHSHIVSAWTDGILTNLRISISRLMKKKRLQALEHPILLELTNFDPLKYFPW